MAGQTAARTREDLGNRVLAGGRIRPREAVLLGRSYLGTPLLHPNQLTLAAPCTRFNSQTTRVYIR